MIYIIYIISFITIITFSKWSYKEKNFVSIGDKRRVAEDHYTFGMITIMPVMNTIMALIIIGVLVTELIRNKR